MIHDIKQMAPIESGVQTLVFWFLKDIVESSGKSLVVIDKMQKTSRFISYGGISDLAIVSKDFDYHGDDGKIFLCVETKYLDEKLSMYEIQILGQLLMYRKALVTNGIDWCYYDLNKYVSEICHDDIETLWALDDIATIGKDIEKVVENNRKIAKITRSMARIKKAELKQNLKATIEECEKENDTLKPKIEEFITKNDWLTKLLDEGIWKISALIDEDGVIDNYKYLNLLSNLHKSFADIEF